MSKTIKRVVSTLLAGVMLASVCFTAIACSKDENESLVPQTTTGKDNTIITPSTGGEYTYRGYTTALGNNWNPHTWETSADDAIASYTTSPFVTMSIKDSTNGVYQWVYEMATAITDVTKDNQGDLTKYGATLPEGKSATDIESGYVYEIKLNPKAKWEDGTAITADDYIYSMQMLLNSKMRNYRANLYYSGESAVAGGLAYYNSEAPIYINDWIVENEAGDAYVGHVSETSVNDDGYVTAVINGEENVIYFSFSADVPFFGASASFIYNDYGYGPAGYFYKPYTGDTSDESKLPKYVVAKEVAVDADEDGTPDVDADGNAVTETKYYEDIYVKYKDSEDTYGVIAATPEMLEDMKVLALNFGDTNPDAWNEFALRFVGYGDKVEYDTVGCYKVDDYTIRYVCQTAIDINYFLTSCTSTWLVHKDLYEANMDDSGTLLTTKYATSKETYMSYGPYKIDSIQTDKQIVFVRNENWYGWEKDKDGNLVSYTNFEVDGEKKQQYQTTRVVIDVMKDDAAKQAFLKGELTEWSPTASELSTYATSEQMYKADETYTMSFFFNTGVDALKEMDNSKGNKNSVVLSNINFRKAFSLSINRAEYVTVTAGYKPAFSLMNGLYYYDVYNDPTSSYRQTEEAMQAIVNLYGVEYGEGKAYATLKEAHDSITGYNLDEAKNLMKTACDELVAAGLYTKGEEIKIRIGWAKGALTSDDNAQVAVMNKFINAAVEGSGFGTVTLEAIGSISDRYGDVAKGEYAIGYGAWGGAAFYPFRNMQVYCDTKQYDVNELGCWDPATETLTITINGEDVTKTWQDWSRCMIGTGDYANADFSVKLHITATMEQLFLEKYYRIPLAGTAVCSLLSYQANYYTQDYNIMYGYGGLRLLTYTYNDADWAAYVQSQGGQLNYE